MTETAVGAKRRIDYYDIAKGIGIILVVWAHARGPGFPYIYQFHMPFFFILSGLLHNEKEQIPVFAKKKFVRLYVPYVCWNGLAVLLTDLYSAASAYDLIKHEILILLTLQKSAKLFGATWFMGSLFLVSITYKILETVLRDHKFKRQSIFCLFTIFSVLGFKVTLPYMQSRTLVCGMFYALGVLANDQLEFGIRRSNWPVAICCFILFLGIGSRNSANMGANQYSNPFLFCVGAVSMSYATLFISRNLISEISVLKNVKQVLVFLGQRSSDIMIWQFVFFRIGIIIQISIHHEPLTLGNVLAYYPYYSVDGLWWLVYTIIGLVMPILFCGFLRSGPWGKALRQLHVV